MNRLRLATRSIGVLECWSVGVPNHRSCNPLLHYSIITPLGYMKSICIIFLLIASTVSHAQQKEEEGQIEVIRDARLDTLLHRYTMINEKKGSIEGFRIQLVASSNRAEIYKVKSQFYSMFPDQRPYVVYQQPNFKLRIGNYRNRLEAYKDLQKILIEFNDAFIIQDELKIEEL